MYLGQRQESVKPGIMMVILQTNLCHDSLCKRDRLFLVLWSCSDVLLVYNAGLSLTLL